MRPGARSLAGLLVGLGLGTGIAGCGDAGSATTDVAPIRVAVGPWITFAPLHVAADRGFFETLGLDVELVETASGSRGIALLLGGELDVLPGPMAPGFFHAVAAGQRVRFVADKGWVDPDGCPFVGLAAPRKSLARGALGPSRAERPRISVSKEGPLQLFVERALERRGLAMSDVDVFHIPAAAEIAAFRAGTLDAAVMSDPHLSVARAQSGVEIIVGIQDVMPGYQFSMLAFGPRLLDREPELGRRFIVAYLQGVRAYNEGKTSENLRSLAAATGHPPEALATMCWMPMRADGRVNLASLEVYRDWYIERGWLSSRPSVEDVFDPSFVEFANRTLGPVRVEEE